MAVENNVGHIIVDNETELERLEEICGRLNKKQEIIFRIKPGVDAHTHDFIKTGQIDSKFGFAIETGEAIKIIKKASKLKNVIYKGIHCHIGSQIFELEPFIETANVMMSFIKEIKDKTGLETDILDFGGGFYVTTSEIQAKKWAVKVAYRSNSNHRCVNRYEFDFEKAKAELSIIHFDIADEKWLNFICDNRSGKYTGAYDIVIGPVADDRVYRVVVEYENGDLDKENALKKLKAEALCDQILFHTEKSLAYLKYIDTEVYEG
jgi:hypothetical protein